MDEEFQFTGPEHRKAVRKRLMRWTGMTCLFGGAIALIEVQPMMAIACAAVGLAFLIASHIAA